ncbi:MAG: beta-lactamase family protein [Cyanosarcina radialis HA8281-LM2]|jgi:hypothetical protein|nr:beta-lactamase family protein [Cyanosarcina radialis HA8281-LM2]
MKSQTFAKLFSTAVIGFFCIDLLGNIRAQTVPEMSQKPPVPPNSVRLSVDTPLEEIYEYQEFFKDINNQPQVQLASPKTAYLWQHMSRILRTAMILRDGQISELPVKIDPAVGALKFEHKQKGKETLNEHFAKYPMDAAIVIHKGTIVHETYKTMRPFDKHNWFSSGKVIPSTLIALLEEEGKVDVKKPVSFYITELKGSNWDTVSVLEALNMSTGLDSTEHDEPMDDSRTNPERGWFQWAVSLGLFPDVKQRNQTPFQVLGQMQRRKPGNTAFEYNSINTWVLEIIVERVSGKPLNEFFGDRIWRKIGAQSDAYVAVTPDGYPLTFGMVSSNLRDLARFGLIFSPSWNKVSKKRIVSNRLLNKIQRGGNPAIFAKGHFGQELLGIVYDKKLSNSYQWDVVFQDGDFYKEGVGGQGLYVSPSRDLVIAWFSTGKNGELGVARAIATSSIFSRDRR